MRQRIFIFGTIALVVLLLIALNAAAYVEIEREPDAEWNPDRSTFNAGATGTRALYDFLGESGYQTLRWREPALYQPMRQLTSRFEYHWYGLAPAQQSDWDEFRQVYQRALK